MSLSARFVLYRIILIDLCVAATVGRYIRDVWMLAFFLCLVFVASMTWFRALTRDERSIPEMTPTPMICARCAAALPHGEPHHRFNLEVWVSHEGPAPYDHGRLCDSCAHYIGEMMVWFALSLGLPVSTGDGRYNVPYPMQSRK